MRNELLLFLGLAATGAAMAQNNPASNHGNKFEALGTMLPTPNEYRTASGAPGPKYWQQRADYDIKATLDEDKQWLTGSETITYFNNSPDELTYLWLQLDENEHSAKNNANYQDGSTMPNMISDQMVDRTVRMKQSNDFGDNIVKITDALGASLKYMINKTMMRVELPATLKPGQKFIFKIDWNYHISDRMKYGGRGGFEYFPEDGNYLFTMAQWYPRLCVYSDFQGWQNNQFTGRGEFALTFGNFKVQMTVPADHVIGATGECQNYQQVLTPAQFTRWQQAQTAKEPIEIVTLAEAKASEVKKNKQMKTWIFKADNVRDFAWGSSRRFVMDAMPAYVEGKKVMCMSYYGKEAYPIYRRFSTKAVAHTIKTYSHFTIPFPYPVAQSVEASNGMEYPMICFNYGRAEKDGTYSEATKYGMLGVVIHEVGHNFFPMIINSDERQWSWMDEGLNSFVEYLTEELWDNKFPVRGKGPAWAIVDYMKLPKDQLEPIMTNSENIVQFGPNAYTKPATGLNMLRETIMGRELFDYAFKEYARRWAFKHPTPADLFRTMNDASAENLDWFWRGWFYGIDAVDISIDSVKHFTPDLAHPVAKVDTTIMKSIDKPMPDGKFPQDVSKEKNRNDKNIKFAVDADTSLHDFYWKYSRGLIPYDTTKYPQHIVQYDQPLDDSAKTLLSSKQFYELQFSNKGGLVMPIILEWTYKDGTKEVERIPAQVWRKNESHLTKLFIKDKEVESVKLDPNRETADIDESNNSWPAVKTESKFQVYKAKQQLLRSIPQTNNPMQQTQKDKKAF
ncbi:M1 family metallopeptidase [Flavitalea sp. BT771]|uniref:M1 family metallopeptidase n=1 Tax=Flavitalea sp. BT771 TaxID=3063329 RepID=UPI0026E2C734|nr:M1 family metallopeptidase [Flavitalea sp. BT771]MDO6432450.1 M1 family metallopeptidase [Flavitalea sp. BT771]MDV6221359.1 M1 family metallopeptidase [Flavitalea sp. BT771]